ncbi:MAG: AI-2E family transporter [Rhizobiaceae bacterium]|jgi:predicted PurR-regulated permease PerM|nr:MAG: AI-2E family transporter [Rhizobiaceae bacterium]
MPKATPRPVEKRYQAEIHVDLRRQAVFWTLAIVLLALFLFIFSDILLPFIAGMALAYFLDPVADRLERIGLSRFWATIVILLAFVVLLALVLVVVVPALAKQLAGLAEGIPSYISALQNLVTNIDSKWLERTLGVNAADLRAGLNSLLGQGAGFLTTLFKSIWSSGVAIINLGSLFVITPVVAFYMLLDWDRMVATVDNWIPRQYLETVRGIARDMDRSIAGFVRGQGTLCLILGIYYATGLTVVGLNFGLLIGLLAGLISFIPYVGSLTGLVLAVTVALVQFSPHWLWIGAVLVVFFVGQFIEGNILQPKLVGSSVGLHPVWLMFALLAFGALFGFVGLLIAVPASAAIGVLTRFGLSRYLASPLYRGPEEGLEKPAAKPVSTGRRRTRED